MELLLTVPELISRELVAEAESAMVKCQDETQDGSVLYMSLGLTAAISYYYLKNGEVCKYF